MESAMDDEPMRDDNDDRMQGVSNEDDEGSAPRYSIPARDMAAVEIPAVVKDVDRAIKAFGRVSSLEHILDPSRHSLPLYINPESPFCKPLMSHNARSHSVVLKVTVPKRTGRRRKRGSDEPWQGDVDVTDAAPNPDEPDDAAAKVCSVARLDDPRSLRRKLADNVGKYGIEAVGTVKHTHRFRSLADFYWDMDKSGFAQRYVNQVLPGDVQKLKEFKFEPGVDQGPNVDIIPPPIFTHMGLPFNYQYAQNPYVRTTKDGDVVNLTAVQQVGHFIGAEDPSPDGPQRQPDMTDAGTVEIIAQLEAAFDDRPIWTRRALLNHLAGKLRTWNELKKYLNYVAYQFKGGPWRDAVVIYGVDPRTDPKYRIYQTVMFKLPKQKRAHEGQTWKSLRKNQMGPLKEYIHELSESHIFDGESYHADGKIWQVCDINDPILKDLLDNAAIRETWDMSSGWYHGGLWAKIKAIMKTKLVAIQFGRQLTRRDFEATLRVRDETPVRSGTTNFHLPLPNLHLTDEEIMSLRGRVPRKRSKNLSYNVRVRDPTKSPSRAAAGADRSGEVVDAAEVLGEDENDVGGEDDVDSQEDEDEGEGEEEEEDEDEEEDEGEEESDGNGDAESEMGNDEDDDMIDEELIDPALRTATFT